MKKATLYLTIAGLIIAAIALTIQLQEKTAVEKNSSTSVHIVNVIDPSGSTIGRGWPPVDRSFFSLEIDLLKKNGGGVLDVFNMSSRIPHPITLEIMPLIPVPTVYDGERAVRNAQVRNDTITARNERAIAAFWNRVIPEVIDFKPQRGKDFTYAKKALMGALKTMNIPKYSTWETYLFLYTDMVNDSPPDPSAPINGEVLQRLNDLNATVCLASHVENSATQKLDAIPVTSFNDFLTLLPNN